MSDQSERRVGFASPPHHSRFKKGKSGNPRGRPKKQADLWTLLSRVLNRKVKLQGSDQQILIREALIRRLRELALAGDRRALDLQRRIMAEAGDGDEERRPPVDTKKVAEFLNKLVQDRKAKEENPDG
jgi:hypothetical protein